MQRYLAITVLLLLVACGSNQITGEFYHDKSYAPVPDPLQLGDYDFIIGQNPVLRLQDMATCAGVWGVHWTPLDFSGLTCPKANHKNSTADYLSFPGVYNIVPYVGPFLAKRNAGGTVCNVFNFSLLAYGAGRPRLDYVVDLPTANPTKFGSTDYYGQDFQANIILAHWNPGASQNCYEFLRFRYAVGAFFDQFIPSVQDGVVMLGSVRSLIDDSQLVYRMESLGQTFQVVSGKKLLVGFDDSDPASDNLTDDADTIVYACLDANEDGECDFDEPNADLCIYTYGGDYYGGSCCGFDVPVDTVKSFVSSNPALCLNSSDGPVFAALDDAGVIVNGLDYDAVSNGSAFLTCGAPYISHTVSVDDSLFSVERFGVSHDFACINGQLFECGGSSAFNTNALGVADDISLGGVTYYCGADGSFSTTLVYSESTCALFGYDWTGTKCCGPLPANQSTYSDPGLDSSGACITNQFYANGEVINDSVLVYFGSFVECVPSLSGTIYRPSTVPVLPGMYEHGACGTYLANASGALNAVCNPDASWSFSSKNYTFLKDVPWTPLPGQSLTGCCASDECWVGDSCIAEGEFVSVAGGAFLCQ